MATKAAHPSIHSQPTVPDAAIASSGPAVVVVLGDVDGLGIGAGEHAISARTPSRRGRRRTLALDDGGSHRDRRTLADRPRYLCDPFDLGDQLADPFLWR